jgi:hypothetical protein
MKRTDGIEQFTHAPFLSLEGSFSSNRRISASLHIPEQHISAPKALVLDRNGNWWSLGKQRNRCQSHEGQMRHAGIPMFCVALIRTKKC